MSDRIVVMNKGVLEQIGTPDEVYNHPTSSYVATFVGNANIVRGKIVQIQGEEALVEISTGKIKVIIDPNREQIGQEITIAVRAENILVCEECKEALPAVILEKSFSGGRAANGDWTGRWKRDYSQPLRHRLSCTDWTEGMCGMEAR